MIPHEDAYADPRNVWTTIPPATLLPYGAVASDRR